MCFTHVGLTYEQVVCVEFTVGWAEYGVSRQGCTQEDVTGLL